MQREVILQALSTGIIIEEKNLKNMIDNGVFTLMSTVSYNTLKELEQDKSIFLMKDTINNKFLGTHFELTDKHVTEKDIEHLRNKLDKMIKIFTNFDKLSDEELQQKINDVDNT